MPHFRYYPHSTLTVSKVIANADLSKNPAHFYILGDEAVERTQTIEQLGERPDLTLKYDLKEREIWTNDKHTAKTLINSKRVKLITWNYPCGWQPLKRGESSPTIEELSEIKLRMLLKFTRNGEIILSGNEKTTDILIRHYGFSDLEK